MADVKNPGKIAELSESDLDAVQGAAETASPTFAAGETTAQVKQRKQMLTWYKDMQQLGKDS